MSATVSATSPGSVRLLPRAAAEALGTLFVVMIALGVPVFTLPDANPLPAPLAGGLAVVAAMVAFGAVSGGHFNPAITVGNLIAGRTRLVDGLAYLVAQLIGALAGAFLLFVVLRTVGRISDSRAAFDTVASGFGEHSVIEVGLAGALLLEVIGAALLVAVYLGAMAENASAGTAGAQRKAVSLAAPIAVGLTVAVLLQLGQAVGNLGFNPARATGAALFSSGWAAGQLWLFWVAPLLGAAIAGLVFRGFGLLSSEDAVTASATPAEPGPGSSEDVPDAGTAPAADGTPAGEAAPSAPAERDDARDFFDGKRD